MTPPISLPTSKRCSQYVIVILVVSLVVRLGVFFAVYSVDPERVISGDSASYEDSARAMLAIGRFTEGPEAPDRPETKRTPGYPAFIAANYFVFGETRLPVIVIQIVLSIGTLWLMYVIARKLCGPAAALVAVLVLALDPASFVLTQKVLTDTLFTLLMVVAAAAGVGLVSGERPNTKLALVLGAALGVGTIVRPIGYYLIVPILGGTCVWGIIARWGFKRVAAVLVLLVAPSVVLVGGWQLRNYLVTGSAEFSHIRGPNLLWYKGAGIVARRDGITLEEARRKIEESLPNTEDLSPAEESDLYLREAMGLIRRHPVVFVKMQLRESLDVLVAPAQVLLVRYLTGRQLEASPFGDAYRLAPGAYVKKWVIGQPALFAAFACEAAYLAVLYCGALYGVWRVLRGDRRHLVAHLLLWGMIVYFVVLSAGPEAHSRFRVPVMPFLALYAGMGIERIGAGIKARREKQKGGSCEPPPACV